MALYTHHRIGWNNLSFYDSYFGYVWCAVTVLHIKMKNLAIKHQSTLGHIYNGFSSMNKNVKAQQHILLNGSHVYFFCVPLVAYLDLDWPAMNPCMGSCLPAVCNLTILSFLGGFCKELYSFSEMIETWALESTTASTVFSATFGLPG